MGTDSSTLRVNNKDIFEDLNNPQVLFDCGGLKTQHTLFGHEKKEFQVS